jgi:hypothetical protein
VLAILLRQRARLLWNRITRGRNRGRNMLGAVLAVGFTFGFLAVAGINAGALVDRVARVDPAAAVQALPVLLVGIVDPLHQSGQRLSPPVLSG